MFIHTQNVDEIFASAHGNPVILARLVEGFPQYRDVFYQMVIAEANFSRFTGNTFALAKLVEIFPEHKDNFYQMATTEANFSRFIGNNTFALAKMIETFPEHGSELNTQFNYSGSHSFSTYMTP